MDNKGEALKAAKEVIEVQERLFPWANATEISLAGENVDRMFSTELVFALQNVNRKAIYTKYFDSDNLKMGVLLACNQKVIDEYVLTVNIVIYVIKSGWIKMLRLYIALQAVILR